MKVTVAAIVAASVLMMPTEGTAQADPLRKFSEEHWSCGGNVTLYAYCLLDDVICSGTVRIGKHPAKAKTTLFEMTGGERRWDWCLNDGAYECAFIILPGDFPNGAYYTFRGLRGAKPLDTYNCVNTKKDNG